MISGHKSVAHMFRRPPFQNT